MAAALELGPLGRAVRGGRVRRADAGLAGRSRKRSKSPGRSPRSSRTRPWSRSPITRPRSSAPWTRSRRSSGTPPVACWRRCSRGGASRRPPWRSTRASSAASCHCRSRRSGRLAVPDQPAEPRHARSRSRSTSSSTAGRTRWTSRRRRSSTTRSTSPAPGSRSSRWATRTSTRGRRRRSTRRTPTAVPLLIIDGEKDHTVPWAIADAAYKRQKRNPGVTEIVKIPNRGHSLTIDHGWREVAETALDVRQAVRLPGPPSASRIAQKGAMMATGARQLRDRRQAAVPRARPRVDGVRLRPLVVDDVSENADAILDRLEEGTMPCDGVWPEAQVDLFRRWTQSGMQADRPRRAWISSRRPAARALAGAPVARLGADDLDATHVAPDRRQGSPWRSCRRSTSGGTCRCTRPRRGLTTSRVRRQRRSKRR